MSQVDYAGTAIAPTSSAAQEGFEGGLAKSNDVAKAGAARTHSSSFDETLRLSPILPKCSLSPLFGSTSPSSTCYESASQTSLPRSSHKQRLLANDNLVFEAMQLMSPALQKRRVENWLSSIGSVNSPVPALPGISISPLQGNERRSRVMFDTAELQSIEQKKLTSLLGSSRSTMLDNESSMQTTEARRLDFLSEEHLSMGLQKWSDLGASEEEARRMSGASDYHNENIEAGCASQSFKDIVSKVLSSEKGGNVLDKLCTSDDEPRPALEGSAAEVPPVWRDSHSFDMSTLMEKLLKNEEKCTALTKLVHVQSGMLQTLQARVFEEQAAHQKAQGVWAMLSRQQEDELAALQAVLVTTLQSGLASGLLVAEDLEKAEAASQKHELQAALNEARVEVVEAEQERFECEQRAKESLKEAAAVLQQEREASAAQIDRLTTLLSEAQARETTLTAECMQHSARAQKAEARAVELEDEIRAAKALWVDGQQKEHDREETIAFLEGQLAVAQTQVELAKLRLSEGQELEPSPHPESERASFPASGEIGPESRPQQYEKENIGLHETAPLPVKTVREDSGKRGLQKGLSRILPSRTGLKTSSLSVKDSVQAGKSRRRLTDRKALGELTNTGNNRALMID